MKCNNIIEIKIKIKVKIRKDKIKIRRQNKAQERTQNRHRKRCSIKFTITVYQVVKAFRVCAQKYTAQRSGHARIVYNT